MIITKSITNETDALTEAIAIAAKTRKLKESVEKAVEEADAVVQRLLRERGVKRANDGQWQATLVEAERVKVDEVELRRNLTGPVWRSLVKEKLDTSKLEEAVASGTISPELLDHVTTVAKNKPYIRLSVYEADEDA